MSDYADLIERLRELEAKATPGPWDASGAKFGSSGRIWVNANYACINGLSAKFTLASVVLPDDDEVGYTDGALNEDAAEANAALIVEARNSLPAMLDALAALTARVAELEGALREMFEVVCGETGFAQAVRVESGFAYPWPALDLAEVKTRQALGEQP